VGRFYGAETALGVVDRSIFGQNMRKEKSSLLANGICMACNDKRVENDSQSIRLIQKMNLKNLRR